MKTSFGEMEILLKKNNKPQVEFLRFQSTGRSHKHSEYESFFVTSGSGFVYIDKRKLSVKTGSLVVIPPHASHWMEPNPESLLEGLLWYHDEPLNIISNESR